MRRSALTGKSRTAPVLAGAAKCKCAILQAYCTMARRLLLPTGMLLVGATLAGCVVPIPAEPEVADAGVNSPPIIVSASPSMPFDSGGPLDVASLSTVSVALRDKDIADTLYLRVFRDYQLAKERIFPIDWRTVTNDPTTGTADRTANFQTSTWCDGAPAGQTLVFDVVVADRDWDVPGAEPKYRAVIPGGETSTRSWVGTCP